MSTFPELDFESTSPRMEPVENKEETRSLSVPTTAAEVFQQIMQSSPVESTEVGNIRFRRFESILHSMGVRDLFSRDEATLLVEVFNEFQNQTLDNPILFLMLSMNRDITRACSAVPSEAKRIGGMQKIFKSNCLSFIDDCRTQAELFTDILRIVPKKANFTQAFAKTTGSTLQLLESLAPGQLGRINQKWALWNKLLALPQYVQLATTSLSEEPTQEAAPSDHKGAASRASIHSIDRMSQALFLTEEEMVDFLIEYVDFFKDYYPEHRAFFQEIKTNLSRMQSLYEEGSTREAQELRRQTIGLLHTEHQKLEARTDAFSGEAFLISLLKKSPQEKETQAKIMAQAFELEFVLGRLLHSLDTLIENQRRLLVAERLFNNLHACKAIAHGWDQIVSNVPKKLRSEMKGDFAKVCITMDTFEPLRIASTFDALQTPECLQTACQSLKVTKRKKIPHAPRFLPCFQELHRKYSQVVEVLKSQDKASQAAMVGIAYRNLSLSFVPLFFCIKDLRNLRDAQLEDQYDIVPDEILDLFDIDSEDETESPPSMVSPLMGSPSPSQSSPERDISPPRITPPVFSTTPPEDAVPVPVENKSKPLEKKQKQAVQPRSQSAMGTATTSSRRDSSPERVRFRRGMKTRKLKRMIKEMFGETQGGRHTRYGRATVISRSSRDSVPVGTLRAIQKQVNHANGFGDGNGDV